MRDQLFFGIGDLIQFRKAQWRVVSIDGECRFCLLILVPGKSWPKRFPVHSVQSTGRFIQGRPIRPVVSFPTRVQIRGERKFQLVGPLITDERAFDTILWGNRRKVIDDYARSRSEPPHRIDHLLRVYWQGGSVATAFFHSYAGCGKGRKGPLASVQGRPSRRTPAAPLCEKIVKQMEEACAQLAAGRVKTIAAAVRLIERKYYTISENGNLHVLPGCFKESQLRYFYSKKMTRSQRLLARVGSDTFNQKHRSRLGRAEDGVGGPCEQFQIDATVADVNLVSLYDRTVEIGRPTMYKVVDTFSRFIVAIEITFDPPSWGAAMTTLMNVVTPKTEYCARFGVTISEDEWPTRFLPSTVLGDRGEMIKTGAVDKLAKTFGIRFLNAPAYRPDMKGVVEQAFNTTPTIWRPFKIGSVEKVSPGARKPKREVPILNINEFTAVMIHAVLKRNNLTLINDYKAVPEFAALGRPTTPKNVFEWGLANRTGTPRLANPDDVALCVLPESTARISERGIRFSGQHYAFARIEHNSDLFSDLRASGATSTDVMYHPRDPRLIWARHPRTGQFELATMLGSDRFGPYPLSRQDIDACERLRVLANERFDDSLSTKAARQETDAAIRRIRARAVSHDAPAPTRPTDVRTVRRQEQQLIRRPLNEHKPSDHGRDDELDEVVPHEQDHHSIMERSPTDDPLALFRLHSLHSTRRKDNE